MFRHTWLIALGALCACGGNNDKHPDAPPDSPPDAPPAPTGTVSIALTSLDQVEYAGPLHTGGQAQAVIT